MSLSNIRSYTHTLSLTWLPKCKLKKQTLNELLKVDIWKLTRPEFHIKIIGNRGNLEAEEVVFQREEPYSNWLSSVLWDNDLAPCKGFHSHWFNIGRDVKCYNYNFKIKIKRHNLYRHLLPMWQITVYRMFPVAMTPVWHCVLCCWCSFTLQYLSYIYILWKILFNTYFPYSIGNSCSCYIHIQQSSHTFTYAGIIY